MRVGNSTARVFAVPTYNTPVSHLSTDRSYLLYDTEMVTPADTCSAELASLVEVLRAHTGLTGKQPIRLVTDYVDASDPVHGPGDDGAIVEIGDHKVVACGEALFPPFVAVDPYGAGIAAVLANVNDVAAMGGVPQAIVNTIVASTDIAAEVLRGMKDASAMYDVPIVGGHLTQHDGEPALSAFAIGEVGEVLSMANVAPGQQLVFVCSLDGYMRQDFPFFTTLDNQGPRLARDIRLLDQAARAGLVVAAKDVSMAGSIGSLAMLLEFSRCGACVDLDRLPTPGDTELGRWLICFPTYAFWLAVPDDLVADCVEFFHRHELEAAAVGVITAESILALSQGDETATVMDLATETITGLWATE